jgi:uncharacterized phage protein (TIGR01671 family)
MCTLPTFREEEEKMKSLRAWDDVAQKMLYAKPEQFDDMLGYRFDGHFETENPVYMWGTGLPDRNGKEIYEGDIFVDNSYGEDVGRLVDSVVWNNETGAWVWGKDEVALIAESVDTIMVIGNLYDNHDLLEG